MQSSTSVSRGVMLRYGAGQLGAQIFRDTPAVLLPVFMTTMLGVPAWLAGLVVLTPKLWVMACDPMMGAWSDQMNVKAGRTPFLLVGAVGASIAFLALFTLTHFPSPYIAAATVCLLYLLASTAFSSFSVPYLALAAELSPDSHERTRLLAYRMIFTVGGVILGVGVAQPLVFHFGGGALGWHVMALVFASVCLVSMLTPALGLRKAQHARTEAASPRLFAQLSSVASNKPFCILLATSFLQSVSQACSYTVIGFFYLYVLKNVGIILAFVLTMSVGSLAAQPLWISLSRHFGKERCFIAASLGFVGITLTWFMVHPGDDVVARLPLLGVLSTQDLLVLVRAFIIGLLNSGFILLALSMLTDTIDLQRKRHGFAQEGVFSGLFSAVEKLAFATGPLIAGVVLSASGFLSSTGGALAQPHNAVVGIQLIYSLIPAGILLASLAVFSQYRAR